MTPGRLLDTRSRAVPAAGSVVTVPVAGRAGVPTRGASAVVVNVTAVKPTRAGWVTLWPDGTKPHASVLNVERAGQVIAAHATVRMGSDGKVRLSPSMGTHLVVDVLGWVTDGTAASSRSGLFVPVPPVRVVDSRPRTATVRGAGNVIDVGRLVNGGPAGAAVVNLTAVQPRTSGWFTVHPAGTALPTASNLNMERGRTIPNLVTVRVPAGTGNPALDGHVTAWTNATTAYVVDLQGWYVR